MEGTTYTCYECFGVVEDHDNDGIGYCLSCRRLVDANGRVTDRGSLQSPRLWAAATRALEIELEDERARFDW